jgi:hypothetical protein
LKLLVEHDRFGTIHSVCVADVAPPFQVFAVARKGWTISEVDAPGLNGKPGTPAFYRKVRSLMKLSAVQVGEAKLVRKAGKHKPRRRKR